MRLYQHILTNVTTGEIKILEISPMDWKSFTRTFQRSENYNSISRSITSPQRFPDVGGVNDDKGGYHFILNAYNTYGAKTLMKYERKKLNNYTHKYDDDYVGVFNLDPISGFTKDYRYIEVKMADSQKLAKLMSRDDIDVDIFSLKSLDNITVEGFTNPYSEVIFTPIDIYLQCLYNFNFRNVFSVNDTASYEQEVGLSATNPLINEIGDRIKLSTTVSKIVYENDLPYSSYYNLTAINFTQVITINITLSEPLATWNYDVYLIARSINPGLEPNETKSVKLLSLNGTGNYSKTSTYNFTSYPVLTGVIGSGGRYELVQKVVFYTTSLAAGTDIDSSIETFSSEADSYEKTDGEPDGVSRGLYSHELFYRLIQLYTSEVDLSKILYSNFLGKTDTEHVSYTSNGLGSKLFNTNGFQLRGLVTKAATYNLKDAFASYDSMNALGMGYDRVNDRFFIEPIEEFYKDEAFPFIIEYVDELKTTLSEKYYWNNALAGYPKVEYEEFQGVNEYNTQVEYSSPIASKTKINIRSSLNADSFGIEYTRRLSRSVSNSKDTKYDNNNYVVNTNSGYTITNTSGAGVQGFIGIGQLYSPGFTPRQNMIKHTGLLSSALWKDTADVISFRKSLKDTNISYNYGTTFELSDIEYSEMNTPFIYPEIYDFEGVITQEMIREIELDPHRYITFVEFGVKYYGYIISVEINDYTEKAIFKLIRANINR